MEFSLAFTLFVWIRASLQSEMQSDKHTAYYIIPWLLDNLIGSASEWQLVRNSMTALELE